MSYAVVKKRLVRADKQRQEAIDYVKKQTELAKYLHNRDTDPTIPEKQIGRSFSSLEFDARLRKLNPNLITETHPYKPDKRCLYWLNSQGKTFVCAFENGFITEHSIFARHEEEVWDQDFIKTKIVGGVPCAHIDKADIPKSEFVPGVGFVYDSPAAPGFKKVQMPWNEQKRGWRTVLAYLVGQFIVTPTQVEQIFGSSNTAMWMKRMGKGTTEAIW